MLDLRSQPKTGDKVLRVSMEHAEGSRKTAITPNWCEKTTWYWKSTQVLGQTLNHVSGNTVYETPTGKSWVDNYHGKYSGEDFLVTAEGHIPRLKVYVDTGGGPVEKTEQDPHTGSGGDYTVDYRNGKVTFLTALGGSDVVTADVYEVNGTSGSCWVLKPEAGKKLKIVSAEVQFSADISIKDTVTFQLYVGGSPYGNPVKYKTMMDYINEANGAKPPIPATTEASPTWRDLTVDVVTYPWAYQAVTELKSSLAMEVRVELEHDVELGGSIATATFYCLSYTE